MSGFLAECSGKFSCCHKMSSVVCVSVCLSVCRLWSECIMTKRVRLGSCSFNENVAQCRTTLLAALDYEIQGGPLDRGLKLEWGGFWLRDSISRKRCEIELGWQLITNRKLYMGFRLQQKLMTLTDFERQFTALSSELCVFWQNGRG